MCCIWLAQERALVRPDQGSSQFVPSNTIDSTISRITGRSSVNGNDRLPGAVLLARARLLERLRGVSLSENRLVLTVISGFSFLLLNLTCMNFYSNFLCRAWLVGRFVPMNFIWNPLGKNTTLIFEKLITSLFKSYFLSSARNCLCLSQQ